MGRGGSRRQLCVREQEQDRWRRGEDPAAAEERFEIRLHRNTIHRDNVGAEMLMAKSTEPMSKGRAMDGTDVGTTEASARVEGEAQW